MEFEKEFSDPPVPDEVMDEDEEELMVDDEELENAEVEGTGSSSSSLAAASPHDGSSSDSSQSPSLKVHSPNDMRSSNTNATTTTTSPSSSQPEKRHVCDICGKGFSYLSILESHKRSHTGEKPFSCHFCEKRFAQKATLQVHERTHTGERPYKCRYCEKTFAQYGTKTVHEKSAHLGIRNYKCPKCDKCLSSPSALYTHKKTHGDKTFCCTFCPKTFALKNYLKLHVKQVHEQNERKHICVYCNKGFAYAGSLQVHIRTHTGERPYTCRYCPKAFASQGNLQSHERTHTGERPFICQFCNRTFIQKSQLTAHEATHANGVSQEQQTIHPMTDANGTPEAMGNFECTLCPRRFPYASALLVHMRKHSGEKTYNYSCGGCGKSFSQKLALNVHSDQCEAFRKLITKGEDTKAEERPFGLQNIYQVGPSAVDIQQLCNLNELKMRLGAVAGPPMAPMAGQSAFTNLTPQLAPFQQQPMAATAPLPAFMPMELNPSEYGPLVGSQPPSSLSDMKVSSNSLSAFAPVSKSVMMPPPPAAPPLPPMEALPIGFKELLDASLPDPKTPLLPPNFLSTQLLLQQLQNGDVLTNLLSQNLLTLATAGAQMTPMTPTAPILTSLLPLLQANMGLPPPPPSAPQGMGAPSAAMYEHDKMTV